METLDDYVMQIRDYIAEHPGRNIISIRDDLGIPEKDILYLIKEKRIELVQDDDESPSNGVCARCGKPVLMEKYCRECKEEMALTMMNVSNELKAKIQSNANKRQGVMNALHDKNY
jgi:bifunctional DNA-binding transcriptional regulator/antitoxin component of YhaV-PrlF toxin-antitoxin module